MDTGVGNARIGQRYCQVTQYGMSPLVGPANLQYTGAAVFLSELPPAPRGEYSERTAQSIDEDVRRLFGESEYRVRATLTKKRAQLDVLASALLEHATAKRSTLLILLNRSSLPALPLAS